MCQPPGTLAEAPNPQGAQGALGLLLEPMQGLVALLQMAPDLSKGPAA